MSSYGASLGVLISPTGRVRVSRPPRACTRCENNRDGLCTGAPMRLAHGEDLDDELAPTADSIPIFMWPRIEGRYPHEKSWCPVERLGEMVPYVVGVPITEEIVASCPIIRRWGRNGDL